MILQPAMAECRAEQQTRLLSECAVKYRQRLLRYFSRIMPEADSEDLAQEVFVNLTRHANLGGVGSMQGYIFRVATNVARDWRRRQVSHVAGYHDTLDHNLSAEDPGPDRILIGRDDASRLMRRLEALPRRTYDVFTLYHFENMSQRAIGDKLGLAIRTVEDHMARANRYILAAR